MGEVFVETKKTRVAFTTDDNRHRNDMNENNNTNNNDNNHHHHHHDHYDNDEKIVLTWTAPNQTPNEPKEFISTFIYSF